MGKRNGAQGRIRTTDTRIFSPLLYQLSYLGIWFVAARIRDDLGSRSFPKARGL